MNGLRTRRLLNDYGSRDRYLFLRPSIGTRVRRFLRRTLFGWIK